MNTNKLTVLTKHLGSIINENSPTILTGMSIAGVLGTVILAVEATPRALQILEERNKEEVELNSDFKCFTKMGIIKETYKCYIPTAISAAITIAFIISSNSIHKRRNAALAGLYTLSEKALKEYQSKVIETIGEKKERSIKDEIAKDRITKNPVNDNNIEATGNGDTLCYDALSGRYFRSDIEQIRKAMNVISRKLLSDMFISLNEVYYELGLSGTKLGDLVGWNVDNGLIEPEFSSQLNENDIPCLVVDFTISPKYTR